VPFRASVFQRLLEPVGRRELNRIVEAHNGNHGVGTGPKAWTCQRVFKTMLFAQFAGLGSLREIEHGLAAQPQALYHLDLRLPRRSTLADAYKHRPAAIFRDVCSSLIGRASRSIRKESAAFIELVDSSPIPLRDPRFGWAEADNRIRGLKMHIGYDSRTDVVDWVEITSPKMSDVTTARDHMPTTPGTTYVFDKGYVDYNWWYHLHEDGALFVTRLKDNAKRRDVRPRIATGEHILEDNDIRIGHAKPRGGATNLLYDVPLREILVERDGKKPMRLITNDLDRPAAEIAALYKERWEIELLFKWIKQNLRIKRFIGRSENAVKIQIYAALIAFLLLRMFRYSHATSISSAKALVSRIKVALFDPFNITTRCKLPPTQPAKLPPSPQLTLNLLSI
jgi:putative transposase